MATAGEVVRGLYASFAAGDVPAVLGACDPSIIWNEAENSLCGADTPYVGPDRVVAGVFQPYLEVVDDFAVAPHNIVDGGDIVAVEGRYTGTIKATGEPVDAQFAHFWEIKDGKVVGFQQYTDTKQWADAVGT